MKNKLLIIILFFIWGCKKNEDIYQPEVFLEPPQFRFTTTAQDEAEIRAKGIVLGPGLVDLEEYGFIYWTENKLNIQHQDTIMFGSRRMVGEFNSQILIDMRNADSVGIKAFLVEQKDQEFHDSNFFKFPR